LNWTFNKITLEKIIIFEFLLSNNRTFLAT
jgi:hypothetical protein